VIERIHNKYVLFTSDGKRVLGKHPTRAKAEAQETAINMSKARAAGDKVPPPPRK
jgi:hypothetical protein